MFKELPEVLYSRLACNETTPNSLVLRIQPNEGIELCLGAKVPGPAICVSPVELKFRYQEAFGGDTHDAYERLILDVMRGDAALFARADEVEAAWQRITPVLGYASRGTAPQTYASGTEGPLDADLLLASGGRKWRTLDPNS
jgi:glucose-6-phosphate 1-dehydrogenase